MNKLILITALALAGMNNARSIGITLDQIKFGIGPLQVEVSGPFSHFSIDNLNSPFELTNYDIDWFFSNAEQSAFFNGSTYVRGGSLLSSASLLFSLLEPVNFLVTGGILQPEWQPDSFTSLGAAIGAYASSMSILDIGSDSLASLSGILNPGQYLLTANGFAWNTESDSHVEFQFTPVGVPDSGSTLMLLGLALGVIGILRLPKALA